MILPLMIISYFHFVRIASMPFEADSPLLIYSYAALPQPCPLQRLKTVARGNIQRFNCSCSIDNSEFSGCYSLDIIWQLL